ncbi:7029_t:CDS:2, partial [Racocetra fulgida]
RYNNDFVELKLLGKGGFASVWQAKNKLDGIEYAIKKISLRGDKIPQDKEKDEIKSENYSGIDFKYDNSNSDILSSTSVTGVRGRSLNLDNSKSDLSKSYSRSAEKNNSDSFALERDWVLFIHLYPITLIQQ